MTVFFACLAEIKLTELILTLNVISRRKTGSQTKIKLVRKGKNQETKSKSFDRDLAFFLRTTNYEQRTQY